MHAMPLIPFSDKNAIPQLGLGVWQVSNDQAEVCVKEAIGQGYVNLDTAAAYGNEAGVGAGIRASGVARESLFITTKLWNDRHGYDAAFQAAHDSLSKLGTDYLDLYLIHWPLANSRAFLDAWRAMIEMQKDGMIKSIGVSNFTQANLELLHSETGVLPVINQIELHPQLPQQALRAFHAKHGIVTQAWSPLAQGQIVRDPVIKKIAAKHGKTPAQVTLRWHIQNGIVVIPKSVTPARIKENIDVFDFTLDAQDMADIDSLKTDVRLGPDPAAYTG